jgi:acyl CoA:acetate/3-ketoacid CoA transferase beta subunit
MKTGDTSISELMVFQLAQQIRDESVAQVGAFTPMALAAALLAKATHAPNAMVYPIGPAGVEISRFFPISLFMLEPFVLSQGIQISHREVVDRVQTKGVAFEPISPAQFDAFGNINLSRIRRESGRIIILPGAAGIDGLSLMPEHSLILYATRHSRQVLVPNVDFITGPGHRIHGKSRSELGIPECGGPCLVITNLCVMKFNGPGGNVRLEMLHPGVTVEQVTESTGFKVEIPPDISTTPCPPDEILRILRQEIDPIGIRDIEFLKRADRQKRVRDIIEKEVSLRNRLATRSLL